MKTKNVLFIILMIFLPLFLWSLEPQRRLVYETGDKSTVARMLCDPYWEYGGGDSAYVDWAADSIVFKKGNLATNWTKMGLSPADTTGWFSSALDSMIQYYSLWRYVPDSVITKVKGLVWDTVYATQTEKAWTGIDSVEMYTDTLFLREIRWTNLGLVGDFIGVYPLSHLRKLYLDSNKLWALSLNAGYIDNEYVSTAPLLEELVANNNFLGPRKIINSVAEDNSFPIVLLNYTGFYLEGEHPHLRVLKLHNNNIHTKMDGVSNHQSLEYIDLSNNKLMTVSLVNNPKLKFAKLSGNILQAVSFEGTDAMDTLMCDHNRFRFSSIPQKDFSYVNFEVQDSVTFAFDNVFHFEKEYMTVRNGKTDTTQFVIYKQRRTGSLSYDLFSDTNYVNEGGKITILKNFEPGLGYRCVMTNGNYPGVSICFKITTKATPDYDYNSAQTLRNFLSQMASNGAYNYQNIGLSDLLAQQWESNVGVLGMGVGIEWTSVAPKQIKSINFSGKNLKGVLDCQYFTEMTSLKLNGNPQQSGSPFKYDAYQVKVKNLKSNSLEEISIEWNIATDTLDLTNCPNIKTINLNACPQIYFLSGLSGKTKLEYLKCTNPPSGGFPPKYSLSRLTSLDLTGCSSLSELYLANNGFSSIDLSSTTKLKIVDLSQNVIKNLTKITFNPTLTAPSIDLLLKENLMDSLNANDLPSDIKGKMKKLDISLCNLNNTKIRNIPMLSNLDTLDISNNNLTSISMLSGLTNLVTIRCSNNGFDTLDFNVLGSGRLSSIICNNNRLRSLTLPVSTTATGGCVLNCSNNQLSGEIGNLSTFINKFIGGGSFNQSSNQYLFSTLYKDATYLKDPAIYIYMPQKTVLSHAKPSDTIDLSNELYVELPTSDVFYGGVQKDTTRYLWMHIYKYTRDTLTPYVEVVSPGKFRLKNLPPLKGQLICELKNKVYPHLTLQYEFLAVEDSASLEGPVDVCGGNISSYHAPKGKTNYQWVYTGGEKISGGDGTDSLNIRWSDSLQSVSLTVTYVDALNFFEKSLTKSIVLHAITKQPTGGNYADGATVTLTVSATPGADFQWYQGETLVYTSSDKSDNKLIISEFSVPKAGDYHVRAVFPSCTAKSKIVPIHIYPKITTKEGSVLSNMTAFYWQDSVAINIRSTNTIVPMTFELSKTGVATVYRIDSNYFLRPQKADTLTLIFRQAATGIFAPAEPINLEVIVKKSLLTIMAVDTTKKIGTVLDLTSPSLYKVEGELKKGDVISSVTLTCDGAAASANLGTYDIVPSNVQGIPLQNYVMDYWEGELRVISGPNSIKESELHANVKVYPNPVANGVLFIDLGVSEDYTIQLIDMTGSVVKEVKDSQHIKTLNVQDLKGIYTLKIQTANEIAIKKIVVE